MTRQPAKLLTLEPVADSSFRWSPRRISRRVRTATTILQMVVLLLFSTAAYAADHLDAPLVEGNGQLDINDLYAFQSPTNADNTVLIMTVNPFAGVVSDTAFGTAEIEYEFLIDNNADAVADITYGATFFASPGGGQNVIVTKDETSLGFGPTGVELPLVGGGRAHAGVFDDPFFFDLAGFNDGLNFTGDDTLAGANVSAIVLEVPSSTLGGSNIGVWARTLSEHHQVDRKGRPAINTVLIPSARKDEFNQTEPMDDLATFGDDVRAAITSLSDAANADALTPILLPDILTIDTSNAAGFLNGRGLADDVIDAELNLLTSGGLTGDGVDANDLPFPGVFPYLAEAHVVPEPSGAVLCILSLVVVSAMRRRRQAA